MLSLITKDLPLKMPFKPSPRLSIELKMQSTQYPPANQFGWAKLVGQQVFTYKTLVLIIAGPTNGSAVPSVENLQTYWSSVGCWLERNNISFWWYEAFDESNNTASVVDQHFGCILPNNHSN